MDAEQYVDSLFLHHLSAASPGRTIEIAFESEDFPVYVEGASVILDGTRVYYNVGVTEDNSVVLQFIAPVFREIQPSMALVQRVAFASKILISVSLIDLGASKDLVICADLLLTINPQIDARNTATYLDAVKIAHDELRFDWSKL